MLENYIQELHSKIYQNNINEGLSKSRSGVFNFMENKIPEISLNNKKILIRRPFLSHNDNDGLILPKSKAKFNKLQTNKRF